MAAIVRKERCAGFFRREGGIDSGLGILVDQHGESGGYRTQVEDRGLLLEQSAVLGDEFLPPHTLVEFLAVLGKFCFSLVCAINQLESTIHEHNFGNSTWTQCDKDLRCNAGLYCAHAIEIPQVPSSGWSPPIAGVGLGQGVERSALRYLPADFSGIL